MEIQKNNISSQAVISAIAGMMFFGPFVKKNIEMDPRLSDEDKEFIMWYVQVWYLNLMFLIITLAATLVNLFWVNPIISWVVTIWCIVIFTITLFSLFACINRLGMWNKWETIMQKIPHKWQIIKSYIPLLNFSQWFSLQDYSKPYRWLKESVLLRTCFIFWTLLLWSIFWIWMLIIIAVRVILLMLNIDIVPMNMKKAINASFSCNPWEIMWYAIAPTIAKLKKMDSEEVLKLQKERYAQWQKFWFWVVLQYALFLWIIYLLYHWISVSVWVEQVVLLIAAILWLFRFIIFYISKQTFLRIPVLSEIVWLIFR